MREKLSYLNPHSSFITMSHQTITITCWELHLSLNYFSICVNGILGFLLSCDFLRSIISWKFHYFYCFINCHQFLLFLVEKYNSHVWNFILAWINLIYKAWVMLWSSYLIVFWFFEVKNHIKVDIIWIITFVVPIFWYFWLIVIMKY